MTSLSYILKYPMASAAKFETVLWCLDSAVKILFCHNTSMRQPQYCFVPEFVSPSFMHFLCSIWARTFENVPSCMCAQRRLKSACASAYSDQCLCCPPEEIMHPWLSKMRPEKIFMRRLIRIFACRTYPRVRFLSMRLIYPFSLGIGGAYHNNIKSWVRTFNTYWRP